MSTRFSSPDTPMHDLGAVPGAGALGADVPGTPGAAAPFHGELGAQLMAVHELGYLVLGEMAVEQVCSRVARLAHDTIAGVDEVSVTVLRGSYADTMATTGPLAAGLEEHQYATDSGPCLHAARHRETVLVADMRTEPRWPAYTARAVHAGVFGSLSVPLTLPQGSCGALNLYTRKPNTFAGPGHQVAVDVAEYAAITLTNTTLYAATTRLAEQCKQAMTSPAVIEQGAGIIMVERRCRPDDALAILAQASRDTHRTLREVAAAVVAQAHRRHQHQTTTPLSWSPPGTVRAR